MPPHPSSITLIGVWPCYEILLCELGQIEEQMDVQTVGEPGVVRDTCTPSPPVFKNFYVVLGKIIPNDRLTIPTGVLTKNS